MRTFLRSDDLVTLYKVFVYRGDTKLTSLLDSGRIFASRTQELLQLFGGVVTIIKECYIYGLRQEDLFGVRHTRIRSARLYRDSEEKR